MNRALLIGLLMCITALANAQPEKKDVQLTERFRKTPLSRVIKTLESRYGVTIAYDDALVQNILVTIDLENAGIDEALERLLRETALSYHSVGAHFVIVPRPAIPTGKTATRTSFVLSGKVLDAESEETLPQATLRLLGTPVATTTNIDGYFTITDVAADTLHLEVRYLGYVTRTIAVRDIAGLNEVTIKLKSDATVLNEVVVLDEYNQPMRLETEAGTTVFNPASLSSLPSLGEQDIFRTLQLLPGVGATDESSAGMIIRGSPSGYNLTLLDGMTIYQQDHFFGAFSIINSDVIKDVRVHKGMFDAKYGGRVSGVVDITTKNGNAVKPAFDVKANLISAKATAELPIGKKLSLFLGGRRSVSDIPTTRLFRNLFQIAQSTNGQINVLRFVDVQGGDADYSHAFHDSNAKLTFRPTSRDNISFNFYVSRDRFTEEDSDVVSDPFSSLAFESSDLTRWGNNGSSLRWGRQWNNTFYSNARVSYSRFFRSFRHDQRMELTEEDFTTVQNWKMAMDNDIHDASYAIDNEWRRSNKTAIEFGLSGTLQETNSRFWEKTRYEGDFPSEEFPDLDTAQNDVSWQHSAYTTATINFTKRLQASPGIRIVYYKNDNDRLYIEPRITASYSVSDKVNLKGAYARSNQFLTQLLYQTRTGSASELLGNIWMLAGTDPTPSSVITSDHFTAGATLRRNEFTYDAEVYYKQTLGVIIDEYLNQGNSNAYGLDLTLQKTRGIHKGWLAYSLSRATQVHPYILEGRRAPSWEDQRHELKIVDMWTLGRWALSSTLIYGSGKPYRHYDVYFFRGAQGLIQDAQAILNYGNNGRLPAYFRLDVAATFQWRMGNRFLAEAGISIHNVTDHKNIKTRRLNLEAIRASLPSENAPIPTYTDVVLLGFSPSVSFRLAF